MRYFTTLEAVISTIGTTAFIGSGENPTQSRIAAESAMRKAIDTERYLNPGITVTLIHCRLIKTEGSPSTDLNVSRDTLKTWKLSPAYA